MAQSTPAATPTTSSASIDRAWLDQLAQDVHELVQRFRQQPVTPRTAYAFEKDLQTVVVEAARTVLEQVFNACEPTCRAAAATQVRYRGQRYRINKRTPTTIATTFGPVVLGSFYYLCLEAGEPGLHPLHVQLGIQVGTATAVLAERAARWAVDFSQRDVRAWLQVEHGIAWSNDRLRRVLREFRRGVVAFRAAAQEQCLRQWLTQAEQSRGRHRPVLAVGRDGIMVPIRGHGYQEASTATVSVYDRRRRRLGTVYLGQMPEAHQGTLTQALTALVQAVLHQYAGPLPRLAYVTDKGQVPDAYYRRVLQKMTHPRQPRQRLHWEWVLDFFHVCGYVSKLREALFGTGGQRWAARMRQWLRQREGGVSQVLRSAMQHWQRQRMNAAAEAEFGKAYRYLRRHRRWMAYGRYQRQGLPIGSGVTEAACKTVFTQRLKRSGMRWHKESGQVIVDLRVLHLSGIWDDVVQRDLESRPLPQGVSYRPRPRKTRRKAA